MAAVSRPISSPKPVNRRRYTKSVSLQPPQHHALPERPNFDSFPMYTKPRTKPRTLCRDFIFRGHCRDMHCSRVHVRHNDMIDLFDYLVERDDCPLDFRSVRRRLTRTSPGNPSRKYREYDRVCPDFLENDGVCQSPKCFRTHLRATDIYNSLLRSQTSVVPLAPVADDHPLADLPEMTDCTTRESILADNPSPHPATVLLPPASFRGREFPLAASGAVTQSSVADVVSPTVRLPRLPGPQQSSVVDAVSLPTVRLPPRLAEPQRASAAESLATERQTENLESVGHSLDIPEESPTPLETNATLDAGPRAEVCSVEQQVDVQIARDPPSLSGIHSTESSVADSAISEGTVTDDRTPVRSGHPATPKFHYPTPAAATPPSEVPEPTVQPTICLDWLAGRCHRHFCKFRHVSPPNLTSVNSEAPMRQLPHSPPAAQTSMVPPPVITSTGNITYPAAPPPPHSLSKSPSAIPGTHAEKKSSRRRQPQPPAPKLQEQTPPPKPQEQTMPSKPQEQMPPSRPTPLDEVTLSVMESTHVKFSGGFAIEKITTAFESPWFVVEDVPRSVGPDQVKHLAAPFGSVQDVRFFEKPSNDSVSRIFSVQMASYREVVRAVDGLDGKDVFGRRITVRLSLGKTRSQRTVRDNYVRVSWPAPCKAGYAGYTTLEAAQKAVAEADGKTECGYWITATIYQSIPIIDAFNVRFSGLPPWAGREFLDKFGPSEGTMLERPNYQAPEFGVPAVRRTLASFGKMVHFQVVPPPYKDGTVRAWCLFESPDVANAVCELNRVPQRSLNMAKISVKRVLSVLEHVPRSTFKLVEQDLRDLQQKVWDHSRGAHLDILSRREGDQVPLRLVAEDSKTLAGLRVELKEILDGDILKEHGQQVWDNFLRHDTGLHFLNELRGCNPDVLILSHSVRRCIRLIGTVERRQPVAAAILDKLSSLRQHKMHVIPLDGQAMGVLGSPDLAAAQQRHGEESIRIDYQEHAIYVRGPDSLHEEVQQIVHTVKLRHTAGSRDDSCPVCLEPPLTPVSLSCGHKWCKACFVSYLDAAADTRTFPISCLGNQGKCKEMVPMKMAQGILPPADFDALALAAFHTYVQARPGEYHYCPTPDCPQAYPNGPRNAPLSCPSCLARICPSCHVEYHEGVTCADREDGGDRLFKEWMRSHDVKKCPGCTAPIERAAGCNHMTCTRCRTHTCWVCLETFPQGQGIYDHMREFHGGIGL